MEQLTDKELNIFIKALKDRSCYDFSSYSLSSLKRRVSKILVDQDMDIDQLVIKIKEDWSFTEKIVKSITVCTTELFRDPEMWISLKEEIILHFSSKESLNIWHAGCSTGQEVYSMMILLQELEMLEKSNIYATDLNQDALDIAARGKYKYLFNKNYLDNFNQVINANPQNTPEQVKVSHKDYFTIDPVADLIEMKPFLTDKAIYKKSDLVKGDNPFNVTFDVIICRNVIIYFNFELQSRVIKFFYRNLTVHGCLLLGSHESMIVSCSNYFDKRNHCYVKKL